METVKVRVCNGFKWIFFYCPGCKRGHSIPVEGPNAWNWNEKPESLTVSPSIRVFTRDPDNGTEETLCHSHVENGQIKFCNDCKHELNGKTVPLPEIPKTYFIN